MPDGRRKRRHNGSRAKRQWYARHRAIRFYRRFGLENREIIEDLTNQETAS